MKFNGKWTLPDISIKTYNDLLNDLLNDINLFSKFKSISDYQGIVGCDSYGKEAAELLVAIIIKDYPELLNYIKKFQENDKFGSPNIYDTIMGKFSPNTLRYIVILGELAEQFGSLDGKNIIEIGSAYGGQCFIISQRYKFKSYTLTDIPQSIELSKQYLSLLEVENIIYQDTNNIEIKESDLVISNFALSELDETGRNFYFDNIISKTKNFYMITNIFNKIQCTQLLKKLELLFKVEFYLEPKLKKIGTGIWIGKRL